MIRRSWPEQFDCIFRGDSTWRPILVCALHQMICCGPIAMAIEQRPDDAAIQNSIKSFVLFLRFPFSDHFAVFWKTTDVQSFGICGPATPAGVVQIGRASCRETG